MTYDILLNDRVVAELQAVVSWYTDKSVIIAEKFETAFSWVMETLRTDQIDYSPFTGDIKKAPVPDFPYFIY